ncbi:hypothetical protein PVK06_047585 [Gossypium arboreum]|uniref:NADH:quinone oxidoreductase/Mrp antiporter transmembrane domain-containing protein n=1 Tax=Gossypium arboreum TaxID=29729 RepID=A0ABR0ME31_GOSAR|nr:hypothetical protein PVK06_047585 [Gossypium arboreum]
MEPRSKKLRKISHAQPLMKDSSKSYGLVIRFRNRMGSILYIREQGQIGYVIIGIIGGDSNGGYTSMITYMMFYISMNLGTFTCIVLFGLRGLPPLAGFFGKLHLF